MRFIVGLLALIICTFMGFKLAQKYSQKRIFYESFASFNKRIVGEVSFAQASLIKIIKEYTSKNNDFINSITKYLIDGDKSEVNFKYLKDTDVKYFKDYVSTLGSVDRNTQLIFLKNVQDELDDRLKIIVDEEKKYKSLYIKLGFLVGLIALIIML